MQAGRADAGRAAEGAPQGGRAQARGGAWSAWPCSVSGIGGSRRDRRAGSPCAEARRGGVCHPPLPGFPDLIFVVDKLLKIWGGERVREREGY